MAASEISFFSPPREVRDQIYAHPTTALPRPSRKELKKRSISEVAVRTIRWATHPPLFDSLPKNAVLINKQFAQEAKQEFFRRSEFHIAAIDQEIFRQCANLTELSAEYGRIFSGMVNLDIVAYYWRPSVRFNGHAPGHGTIMLRD